ncbi:hypothetical protein B7494_g944 [Chlorociboria aeruginascens]|nr:hypothetical protein B7494_g944 [Chlorociboria aeruginascens]
MSSFLRPLVRRSHGLLKLQYLRTFSTKIDSQLTSDNRIRIIEVGPRDGLQNEKKIVPLTTKIELIERLAKTGLENIEAGSFVAPKWVPQMADSGEILEYILKTSPPSTAPINYSFLVPNNKGLSKAMTILRSHPASYNTFSPPHTSTPEAYSPSNPVIEISVFAAATESFTQKNLNCDIATSLERFKEVIIGAKGVGHRVRAYISVVLGCPFEGYDVNPQRVAEIATDLLEMGADEIDLGDTTGMGTASSTRNLLLAMEAAGIRKEDIAMHFHDTYGQALVNTLISLEHGIRSFDSSVGGLGGCPYSPGATGNVATEDMVYFLNNLGLDTGVDLDAMVDVGQWITREIGKDNASSVGKAIIGKRERT